MGLICKLIHFLLILLIISVIYLCWNCFNEPQPDLQSLKLDGWFGLEKIKENEKIPNDPIEIHPFHLNISQLDLDDLHQRLKQSRFIDHIPDTKFQYGFNSDYLKTIQKYWLEQYDWKKFERKINSYPQFLTKIEGINLHFFHIKPSSSESSKNKIIVPILLLHGWPGSFWENFQLIPLLLEQQSNDNVDNDADITFELIIPSTPGFGYSEAPHQKNFDISACARIFTKLMKRLGYSGTDGKKYFIHGGDFGNAIARVMGLLYPENVYGLSLIGNYFQPTKPIDFLRMTLTYFFPKYYLGVEDYQKQWSKLFPLNEHFKFMLKETGYMHLQATKPDTIGSTLIDSPIGMAAYILEKFSTWTNPNNLNFDDGKLLENFKLDDLLTNLMIYWTSGNIASSQRFYLENLQNNHDKLTNFAKSQVKVPVSILEPKYDFQKAPKKLIESQFNYLIQFTELNLGGHFLTLEHPKIVSNDIKKFVKKVLKFVKQQQNDTVIKHDEI